MLLINIHSRMGATTEINILAIFIAVFLIKVSMQVLKYGAVNVTLLLKFNNLYFNQVSYFCRMKAHFIKLFRYNHYYNMQMLPLVLDAGETKPAILLAHILAAQQIWLARCKGLPITNNIVLWPAEVNLTDLGDGLTHNHTEWEAYLDNISESRLDDMLDYKNLQGQPFTSKLIDIFTHAVNHGTHHRAQIGQHLKLTILPATDYIAFTRL
ncbi:hypothetical protein DJ568_08600 [Mucilaginibacter hurinus]|uniref:DinB-like domain-containing protein n=1 Tax=Mucilaginibacter hurinus TaxID=2201324 RepID=A0A367GP32_9SPHI|nr:DinB family protein [Mucilaginibacter hurinus]RCH55237.1 hypothetical protein DJ568_08600 [Mucilaginibacter hurinus]